MDRSQRFTRTPSVVHADAVREVVSRNAPVRVSTPRHKPRGNPYVLR